MGFILAAAIIGAVVAVAGTAVSIAASQAQAQQQQKAAKAEQQYAQYNADQQTAAAAYAEQQYRRRAAIILGQETAIAGASGLDISSGAPLLLELDNTRQSEMEALNTRRTGQVGATESFFQGQLAGMRARFASSQAGYAALSGGVQSIGTGVSATSSILRTWNTPTSTSSGPTVA